MFEREETSVSVFFMAVATILFERLPSLLDRSIVEIMIFFERILKRNRGFLRRFKKLDQILFFGLCLFELPVGLKH